MRLIGKESNFLLAFCALLACVAVLSEAEEKGKVPFFVSDYFIRNSLQSWGLSYNSLNSQQKAKLPSKKKSGLLLEITSREFERILQPNKMLPLIPVKVSVVLEDGKTSIANSVDLPHVHNLAARKEYAARNILKVCSRLPLHKHEVMQAVQFIEEDFFPWIAGEEYYLPKEVTGLMGDIEYDPATGYYFIHFDQVVGEGCCKIVTLSILYGVIIPEMVATTVPRKGMELEGEVAILKSVQHIDRVMHLIADPRGGRHKMITTFYERGSLANATEDKQVPVETIALWTKDLLEALERVHRSGIVHLDIHPNNLLLERNQEGLERLVLIDWGTAKVLTGVNSYYKQSDLYSAAVTLYGLLYPKVSKGVFYQKLAIFKEMGKRPNQFVGSGSLLLGEISEELTARKKMLDEAYTSRILNLEEGLERIILHMLHPLKEESRDALYWYLELESLLNT